jgi:L-ascorbate metabolism protein UlaG (beta-lactamase superfamily)
MLIHRFLSLGLFMLVAGLVPLQAAGPALTYFGRATVKIVSVEKFVVYIDPFAPGDLSEKADLVLVTHGHDDHNRIASLSLKPDCVIAAPVGAVEAKNYRIVKENDTFTAGPVTVKVVPAYNRNHQRGVSVGYVLTVNGVTLYHAGDTSYIPEMEALAPLGIDYALFPTDGKWNMDGAEARRCADAVKAHHALAIHSSPDGLYDAARAAKLVGPDVLPLALGQTLALVP